jgi:adenylate kinase
LKLIFLYGLPGVGKLTVARELAELTGYKLFHNHLTVDLAASVFEFGSDAFVELREAIWLAVFKRAARAQLDGLIFTFAPDRTVGDSFIPNATRAVEQDGGEIIFVELTCAGGELERRLVHPARGNFGKLNSVERFRELNEAGAFVTAGLPATRLMIETTELSAPEAAERIFSRLKLERSRRSNIA